jgi:voltage-gated potassium channel
MEISQETLRKTAASAFISIIIASTIAFKILEDQSWVNSFYFVVVTMSTVGYEDITTNESSKIIVIILIITSILSIGLGSQLVLDRIIKFQLTSRTSLPTKPLNLSNHVIIGGYGAKGRRLAEIFRDRRYIVVIVEVDEERSKLAELAGYQVIRSDISKPGVLRILSLEKAAALCLLLSDDNFTIQASILARSYSQDIRIYAEIGSLVTYDIIKFAGVDKPISQIDFLANIIRSHLLHYGIHPFQSSKDLILQEAVVGVVQVFGNKQEEVFLRDAYPLGQFSTKLNEFYLTTGTTTTQYSIPTQDVHHQLFAMHQEHLVNFDRTLRDIDRIPHDRIIFAGYGEYVDATLNRLDLRDEHEVIIIYEDRRSVSHLRDKGYSLIQWTIEFARDLLSELIKENDFVICSFEDITNSLYLAVNLRDLDRNTHYIQLVPYEFDIEAFVKVGADAVIAPQLIISNAIISTFTQDNQIPPSHIFTNGHLFEYVVEEKDDLVGNTVKKLQDRNLFVVYLIDTKENKMIEPELIYILQPNDRVILWFDHRPRDYTPY